jgi:arylsulfatase A-like enzyme
MHLRALLLGLLACACGARPPDVILISVDTLRRDALAAYEPAAGALPELDRFAAECVRYEDALSSAPWTLPAHASLLTGLYPDRHGATDRRVTLDAGVETLAGALARAGYDTLALTGGGFLDAKYGLGRGFARYEARSHSKQEPAETMAGLLERLRGALAARSSGKPLFLFLHTYAVHNYYDARAEAAARTARDGLKSRKEYVDCVLGRESCPRESWDELEALYRAELELFDRDFGELRAELERAGLWENAVVVLLSDHGEGFEPERGRIHHGGRLHADQLAIPLLVRAPGTAPRAERARVSIVDVMPTLLELAGAAVPPGLDGLSFAQNLRTGTPLAPRALLAMEHYFAWEHCRRETSGEVLTLPRELAVIDEDGWYITGAGADELYAPGDEEQARNSFPDARQAERFRGRLGPRPFARADTAATAGDEQLDSALDALGYGGKND